MNNFTFDFFSRWIPDFEVHLRRFIGQNVSFLEIGSYEGKASLWLLDNILTHEGSHLICIDIGRHKNLLTLAENLSKYTAKKVQILPIDSGLAIATLIAESYRFDFIYVDCDHDKYFPLRDMVMAYEVLKVGGLMCIDDVKDGYMEGYGNFRVKTALDCFLQVYNEQFEILQKGYQVWMKKIK